MLSLIRKISTETSHKIFKNLLKTDHTILPAFNSYYENIYLYSRIKDKTSTNKYLIRERNEK